MEDPPLVILYTPEQVEAARQVADGIDTELSSEDMFPYLQAFFDALFFTEHILTTVQSASMPMNRFIMLCNIDAKTGAFEPSFHVTTKLAATEWIMRLMMAHKLWLIGDAATPDTPNAAWLYVPLLP